MVKYVKDSYNKICGQWSDFCSKRKVNKCIVDFTQLLEPGCRVLDVGCGTGYPIAAYLAENGFSVTGVDVSEEMIKRAESLKLPNAEFFTEDILNFHTDKKFSAVIAFDSLWHIEHDRQKDIYGILSSLMESGGMLLFTHGRTDGEIISEMFGEKFYNSAIDGERIKSLLKENGFEILSFIENYIEETTGDRDLLVIAKKL